MWKFLIDNWLVTLLGGIVSLFVARFLYKWPRLRALLQPAKEMQNLISERDDLARQLERVRTERDRDRAFKEGLLDEVEVLRHVRDEQRTKLDLAKAEAERLRSYIEGATSILHDSEI